MSKDKNYYDHGSIEQKWQEVWEKEKTFSPDLENAKNPYYNLMMFPYPSAEGLHVGNMYAFTGADVYARFNRMQGKDVFEPIGLDGFGIHSENYALKVGRHPKEQAEISEKNFYRQMRSIGNSFDWERTLETYDPLYYRWTQWLFVQMFKNGLAYRKKAQVNWCPSCKTVLSDEQVIDTKCERCSSVVEKRELEQWFFRITKYAQKLLDNLETLDWTEKVKTAQRNWIGRSEGARVRFTVHGSQFTAATMNHEQITDNYIEVFTTRPDTLFGATFLVLSPEHQFVASLLDSRFMIHDSRIKEVSKYIELAKSKTEKERAEGEKDKTGVFTGLYAINPVNNEKIPVWVADYVLMGYGTGAIMAVPAHDERDFEFAKKYDLPIRVVIEQEIINSKSEIQNSQKEAYVGSGKLISSGEWNGWNIPEDISKVLDWLEEKGIGEREVNYHLRDWLISRQRYWGPPIPMVYCSNCADKGECWFSQNENVCPADWNSTGWYPVLEDKLPVLLPDVKDWKPLGTGKAPLANHPEFYKTKCPSCGSDAVRETDVSDTFLDSAWYFLRYTSVGNQKSKIKNQKEGKIDIENNEKLPFDTEIVKKWLPIDVYIGGAEHSVLHLLYSRFITSFLADLKLIAFDEPYKKFFAHGLIIKDGAKMSKSKGNVVVPDEYIKKYGADTLRLYLMFIGPFSQGGDFRDSGIEGMNRFVRRVWKLLSGDLNSEAPAQDSLKVMHKTIRSVSQDVKDFSYNTAIARLMEWYNFLSEKAVKEAISLDEAKIFIKLIAPFAPHMAEELWQTMKQESGSKKQEEIKKTHNSEFMIHDSIHFQTWPKFEEKYLMEDEVTIIVQVNGKKRGEFKIESSKLKNKEEVEQQAKSLIGKYLEGKEVIKTVYVPGKIVNFVLTDKV